MNWQTLIEDKANDSECRVCYGALHPRFDPRKRDSYRYVITYFWKIGEDVRGSSELVSSITRVTTSASEFYSDWLAALDGVDPTAAENN